ncbi:Uncharacterised protein [Vibrio cholerae]|nr:Uncharacterised protein [Vibrio cholerae]CSC29349.1 Uncharacterised protein [Vibrio cholerae]
MTDNPASIANEPASKPQGNTAMLNGSIAIVPCQNSRVGVGESSMVNTWLFILFPIYRRKPYTLPT